MSRLWWFYSFCPSRFDAYFGGGEPDALRQIEEAAAWDAGAWEDISVPRRLAARIAAQGITYAGLVPTEISALDEVVKLLFSPEGLWEPFQLAPESPDGLSPSLVQELLTTNRDKIKPTHLPWLVGGRRFGDVAASDSGYCLLSQGEVAHLLSEVRQALAAGGPWRQAALPDVVQECLVAPLESATRKDRPLFGRLG